MKIEMNDIVEKLAALLKIPSPTGDTERAIDYVKSLLSNLGLETRLTGKGALIASIPGKDPSKSVTMSGHVDTLGAMVKEIKDNGRLKISQLGAYIMSTVEGEHVEITTLEGKVYTGTLMITKASSHVHGDGTKNMERSLENMEIRLDEIVSSREDVEALGMQVGDFVSFDPRVVVTPAGFIKSRHLDDKAGVAALYGIAKQIKKDGLIPKYTTHFFISNYEEVGHGASAAIPNDTFEFIAVDMAAPGEGQTSDEFSVTICAKDSTGPYDLELRRKLVELSKKNNIRFKTDIYPYYGSDASAALSSGYDFRVGLIGPGVDASHSFERTHRDAIEETIKLGVAYLTQ